MRHRSEDFPPKKPGPEEVDWYFSRRGRLSVKKAFAKRWLKEKRYHRYRYYVERCNDGARIFLTRPTQLNKGIDFQVRLEGYRRPRAKRRSDRPSHGDVIRDLQEKLRAKPRRKTELFKAICEIFELENPSMSLQNIRTWSASRQVFRSTRFFAS